MSKQGYWQLKKFEEESLGLEAYKVAKEVRS